MQGEGEDPEPSSLFYISQGQKLHYVDWGNPDAPPLILIHGRRDHCRAWDWVAAAVRHDWHVMAVDLRGHGNSAWVVGGAYSLSSFIYDLAEFIHQQGYASVSLIGHSLGGNVALRYAGIQPEMVQRVIAIEGLGPSPQMLMERAAIPIATQMRTWFEEKRKLTVRGSRSYPSMEDAVGRLRDDHPYLTHDQAWHLTRHGTMRLEDGRYGWLFDRFVRYPSPAENGHVQPDDYWRAITAPTLLVHGGDSWAGDPGRDGRLQHFANARVATVPGAGHWVHHERLDAFLALARAFLDDS